MSRVSWFLSFMTLLLVYLLTGCAGVTAQYSAADRATYDAIAPEYLGYVEKDGQLSPEQKGRRAETVRSWQARLDQAEGRQ